MRNIAIVTGASSGVGREFVHQLDRGAGGPLDEIWVVARRQDRLDQLVAACGTTVRTFALDLTKASSFDVIEGALAESDDANVAWLVNSAGFGKFGSVQEIGSRGNGDMIRLNCLALVEMCYRTLPHMHAGSRIVNMASIAALVPQPGLSVYAASKSFVLSFSRALDEELGGVGIHVTAVCPKFMNTEFLKTAGNAAVAARMTFIGFEEPRQVVRKALMAGVRGDQVCVPAWDMKVLHVLTKVLPSRFVMAGEQWVGDWVTEKLT